jgi:hypothetical protein
MFGNGSVESQNQLFNTSGVSTKHFLPLPDLGNGPLKGAGFENWDGGQSESRNFSLLYDSGVNALSSHEAQHKCPNLGKTLQCHY